MKIALLNDLHDGVEAVGARRCEMAPILLNRAVRRLNELERPDITLILGDLLNDGDQPDAKDRLASRKQTLDRIKLARRDFQGPIVSLQHVCLFPPERAYAPHNLTNAPAVIRAMKAAGVALSVSGHHHLNVLLHRRKAGGRLSHKNFGS